MLIVEEESPCAVSPNSARRHQAHFPRVYEGERLFAAQLRRVDLARPVAADQVGEEFDVGGVLARAEYGILIPWPGSALAGPDDARPDGHLGRTHTHFGQIVHFNNHVAE